MTKAGRVYLKIARNALDKWAPNVSERTKQKILGEANYEFLENNYVHGHESISEGVISLRKSLKEEAITLPRGFTDHVKYGRAFDVLTVREEMSDLPVAKQAKIAMKALADIHDRWVRGNSAKFFDAARIRQRYMFMPIELLGLEAAKLDFLFLEPILEEIGMEVSENDLRQEYVEEVVAFRYANGLQSRKGVINYVMLGVGKYAALDATIKKHLHSRYDSAVDVADQVIDNLREDGFVFQI